MALDPIHAFYCRKEYLDLAQSCKIASGGVCARCGDVFDIGELRPHHKIELTLDNVDDPQIALNPANIEVLCHECHNATHNRFGQARSKARLRCARCAVCRQKNVRKHSCNPQRYCG